MPPLNLGLHTRYLLPPGSAAMQPLPMKGAAVSRLRLSVLLEPVSEFPAPTVPPELAEPLRQLTAPAQLFQYGLEMTKWPFGSGVTPPQPTWSLGDPTTEFAPETGPVIEPALPSPQVTAPEELFQEGLTTT